jgi:hypothetical protein
MLQWRVAAGLKLDADTLKAMLATLGPAAGYNLLIIASGMRQVVACGGNDGRAPCGARRGAALVRALYRTRRGAAKGPLGRRPKYYLMGNRVRGPCVLMQSAGSW